LKEQADRWRNLLQEHGSALLLFARQWSANRSDAEDAVQAGFVKFWKSRAQARDETAYLYACVRSAAMDLGRSERRRSVHEHRARRDDDSSFVRFADLTERHTLIEAALRQLPADQREVVVMKVWGGLTFAQIGLALGVSLNTASSRYRYALARLEIELSEEVANE
jgi:RNA polymerase sigma-70 factor, ECF subfamily